MSEKVELELKIKGGDKAVKTLGQLEQELDKAREAIKEVEVGSDAFKKLATKIQNASSEVKTLEKQMEGLEPQQKAEAFLKMGEGIAGGFAVGQGAMALMGVESENLEKLQVKVQAAISIAMGVRMMSEAALMATTAKRVIVEKAGNVATKAAAVWAYGVAAANGVWATVQGVLTGAIGASSIALGVLKVAIMATGIGALVIGVVALVSAMSSWFGSSEKSASSTRRATKAQDSHTKALREHNDELLENARNIQSKMDAEYALQDAETEGAKELERRNQKLIEEQEALNEVIKEQEQIDQKNRDWHIETHNERIEQARERIGETEGIHIREEALLKFSLEQRQKWLDQIDAEQAKLKKYEQNVKDAKTAVREQTLELKDQEKTLKDNEKEQAKRDAAREKRKAKREKETEELFNLEQELFLMRIADENEREKAKIEQDRQNDLAEVKRAGNKEEQIALIKEKYDLLEAERKQKIADEEEENVDEFLERLQEVYDEHNETAEQQEVNAVRDKYEQLILEAEKYGLDSADLKEQQEAIIAEIEDKYRKEKDEKDAEVSEKQQKRIDALADFKASIDTQGFALAKELGGKNKKIQKGIAVSETIFNTQKAVMRALADIPAPFGAIQAGIHGAMGAFAVRNILSESMGDVSAGGGGTTEPMTPSTTGAFSLGGALPDQEPVKAYVVTDEMSDSQAQLSDIRRRSTI